MPLRITTLFNASDTEAEIKKKKAATVRLYKHFRDVGFFYNLGTGKCTIINFKQLSSKPPYGGVTVYEGLDLEKATEEYNKILNS